MRELIEASVLRDDPGASLATDLLLAALREIDMSEIRAVLIEGDQTNP